jgi:hypothetical protein
MKLRTPLDRLTASKVATRLAAKRVWESDGPWRIGRSPLGAMRLLANRMAGGDSLAVTRSGVWIDRLGWIADLRQSRTNG